MFVKPESIVLLVGGFLIAACIGSFMNVVFYRLPRGLSVSSPKRSFCPKCKNQIPWHDNIPVLGWIMLKGKCRKCACSISIKYPAIELAFGLAGLWLVWLLRNSF